jgi:hypothetical protein
MSNNYALTLNKPNEHLVKYLNHPTIKSIVHTGEYFKMNDVIKKGIHKTLKKMYYPHYKVVAKKRHKKTKLKRKGSSAKKGEAIDKHIFNIIKNPKKKFATRNSSVKALISYWEEGLGHTLQAAQVPVFIKSLNCCTQADVITEDKEGRLFMWEVKSGFNARKSQGNLLRELCNVPNNEKNQWQLQRHYTTEGMKDLGLPIISSQVINVYEEGSGITVKRKSNPKWCQLLSGSSNKKNQTIIGWTIKK